MKYGDNQRLPLVYLPTYTSQTTFYYEFPKELPLQPFEYYQSFPKLSEEILLALFASIGVAYVPEVCLYQLNQKSPFDIFDNFCRAFGEEENEKINSLLLNDIIVRLKRMDSFRQQEPLDSREVYKALIDSNLEKADRLIDEMRDEHLRYGAFNNLKKRDNK